MKIYELAKRVANFVWDADKYESYDQYGWGGFGELVSETIISLSTKHGAKALYDWLKEFAYESRIPEDTDYAEALAKEVKTLC